MTALHTLSIHLNLQRAGFALHVQADLPMPGITVVFGPSGSGKTTLLRCIAGLEQAQGSIQVGDLHWQGPQHHTPTWQRDLGYVFQEASLFEHLNVRNNLAYGLRRSAKPGGPQALQHAIDLLGIAPLLSRPVNTLSGGERQRVSIARALATQPRVLLLDEPLAALDPARKKDILPWLERLKHQLNLPMVYVTHSTDELARLADHVLVLESGQVQACGPVHTVMAHPALTRLLGDDACVVLEGHVGELDHAYQLARVDSTAGRLWVRDPGLALGHAVRVRVPARSVSLSIQPPQGSSIQNILQGHVQALTPGEHHSQMLVSVLCGTAQVLGTLTRRAVDQLHLQPGQAVWCHIKSAALFD